MRLQVHHDPVWQLEQLREVTEAFSHQFTHLIEQINASRDIPSQGQVLRACVEAISLLLDTQSRMADMMSRLHDDRTPLRPNQAA